MTYVAKRNNAIIQRSALPCYVLQGYAVKYKGMLQNTLFYTTISTVNYDGSFAVFPPSSCCAFFIVSRQR